MKQKGIETKLDEKVRQRLSENALAIEKFRALTPNEQEWLLPLLTKGILSTLKILDMISGERLTFEEIGEAVGLSPITVSQKLNALAQGGMSIDLSESAAYAPTGRPRKLARR